jgi:hypothetical protein
MVSILLTGCVHDTSESIRSSPGEFATFDVAAGLHEVSQNIYAQANSCWGVSYPASQIHADILQTARKGPGELEVATVTVNQDSPIFGSRILWLCSLSRQK